MKVLVLNAGSSSIKYAIYALPNETPLVRDVVEHEKLLSVIEQRTRIKAVLDALVVAHGTPDVIGHRVVHGGVRFRAAARIDAEVIDAVRDMTSLAPRHNPANLAGIEAAMAICPEVPQVAVFDTAFHQTLPERAWRYAVPEYWLTDFGVRRYGFHGTSIRCVSREAAVFLGRDPAELALVVLHLGNGASATAVEAGQSVDTSMGLSTLDGLVMGTRCGDLDPGVVNYVSARAAIDVWQVERALHRDSGLKALCGASDMREIESRAAAGDSRAELALDVFCYRARRHIGALTVAMGRIDGLVFTGGIGENSAAVRARICAGLGVLGVQLDPVRNAAPGPLPAAVQSCDSRVALLVIATDEELEIAREACGVIDADAAP